MIRFRVQSSGFRDQGLGLRVEVREFEQEGLSHLVVSVALPVHESGVISQKVIKSRFAKGNSRTDSSTHS